MLGRITGYTVNRAPSAEATWTRGPARRRTSQRRRPWSPTVLPPWRHRASLHVQMVSNRIGKQVYLLRLSRRRRAACVPGCVGTGDGDGQSRFFSFFMSIYHTIVPSNNFSIILCALKQISSLPNFGQRKQSRVNQDVYIPHNSILDGSYRIGRWGPREKAMAPTSSLSTRVWRVEMAD